MKEHAEQPLDLFCIICRRPLCVLCKDFSHENCEQNIHLEHERYRRGFLNIYVQSSNDRKLKFSFHKLSRIVYIADFAREARRWLNEVVNELVVCTNYLEEYKLGLMELIDIKYEQSSVVLQSERMKNKITAI